MSARHPLDFLTSLRGIAALWVVIYHIKVHLINYFPAVVIYIISKGYLAVDFFFVLSGFIIAMSYQNKVNLTKTEEITLFFKKRIARVYPLHLFMLLCYLIIPLAYYVVGKDLGATNAYSVDNFFLSVLLINNWGFGNGLSWNIPSWSISTEFAAYLLFPLLTLFFKFKRKIIYIFYIILSAIILEYIFTLNNTYYIGDNIAKLSLIRCIIEFFIGMSVWNIYKNTENNLIYLSSAILFTSFLIMGGIIKGYFSEVLFTPIALALLLFGLVSINERHRIIFLFSPVLIYLGEISYSIYLSHYFIKDIFKLLFLHESRASIAWLISYFITVIIFSMVTYKYIEQPMRHKIGALKSLSLKKGRTE